MKIAILGGTGKMGKALAKRLAKSHQVIIGSRDPARAREAAKDVSGASGADYHGAAREADVVAFAIPFSSLDSASELAEDVKGKLVLSLLNPIRREGGLLEFAIDHGSSAERLAGLLPGARVATAFNNVPYAFLEKDVVIPMDILIAADSKETYEEAASVVKSIAGMRPLYAGPLNQAGIVERITPLVLNLAALNGTGSLTTKFVSRKG